MDTLPAATSSLVTACVTFSVVLSGRVTVCNNCTFLASRACRQRDLCLQTVFQLISIGITVSHFRMPVNRASPHHQFLTSRLTGHFHYRSDLATPVTSLLSFTLSAGMVALSPVLSGISVGSLDVQPLSPFSSASRCVYHPASREGDINGIAFIGITRQLNRNRTIILCFITGADLAPLYPLRSQPAGPGPPVLPAGL